MNLTGEGTKVFIYLQFFCASAKKFVYFIPSQSRYLLLNQKNLFCFFALFFFTLLSAILGQISKQNVIAKCWINIKQVFQYLPWKWKSYNDFSQAFWEIWQFIYIYIGSRKLYHSVVLIGWWKGMVRKFSCFKFFKLCCLLLLLTFKFRVRCFVNQCPSLLEVFPVYSLPSCLPPNNSCLNISRQK